MTHNRARVVYANPLKRSDGKKNSDQNYNKLKYHRNQDGFPIEIFPGDGAAADINIGNGWTVVGFSERANFHPDDWREKENDA